MTQITIGKVRNIKCTIHHYSYWNGIEIEFRLTTNNIYERYNLSSILSWLIINIESEVGCYRGCVSTMHKSKASIVIHESTLNKTLKLINDLHILDFNHNCIAFTPKQNAITKLHNQLLLRELSK